jgi:hypothetical protein
VSADLGHHAKRIIVPLPDRERRKKGVRPPERDRERAAEEREEPETLDGGVHRWRGEELGKAKTRESREPSKYAQLGEGIEAHMLVCSFISGRFRRSVGPPVGVEHCFPIASIHPDGRSDDPTAKKNRATWPILFWRSGTGFHYIECFFYLKQILLDLMLLGSENNIVRHKIIVRDSMLQLYIFFSCSSWEIRRIHKYYYDLAI